LVLSKVNLSAQNSIWRAEQKQSESAAGIFVLQTGGEVGFFRRLDACCSLKIDLCD
jgi:hypothetical protein